MNSDVGAVLPAVMSTVQTHARNLAIWGSFFGVLLIVFIFFSSGDFSFLLTLASLLKCFGFGLLNYKVWSSKSVTGISFKTMQLYVAVFLLRLCSIFRHQGYLPFDKSGDWLYHIIEVMSLGGVSLICYAVFGPLLSTYDEKYDKFGNLHVPNELGALYVLIPCILSAVFFHPSLNHEFFSDTVWAASMYLEALAMGPQLYMFQKEAGDKGFKVDGLLGHTVFAVAIARLFELIFWIGSFKELSTHHVGSTVSSYLVLLSQIAHMVIMGDFFYYYFISVSQGKDLEIKPVSYASDVV